MWSAYAIPRVSTDGPVKKRDTVTTYCVEWSLTYAAKPTRYVASADRRPRTVLFETSASVSIRRDRFEEAIAIARISHPVGPFERRFIGIGDGYGFTGQVEHLCVVHRVADR